MVLSYYLIRPVYTLSWWVLRPFRKRPSCILYCEDVFDAKLFANVQKYLKPIPIVAKNRAVCTALGKAGFKATCMPAFPDMVIMFRNMAWKFPCKKIIKIGFEHGAYNFKRFSKAHYYNLFDVFFMTSSHDVERVQKLGVTTARAIGYPKIDSVVDGSISPEHLSALSATIGLDPKKKTLLFSATWDGSGISAVHLWYNRIASLCGTYNILVTLHPWVSDRFRSALKAESTIHFIDDYEIFPYMLLADICIGDTNSLIAEFCMLDKPTITFRVPTTPRTLPDVIELLEHVSLRIETFEELPGALERLCTIPSAYTAERKAATRLFFDEPDGLAGKRAADSIISMLPDLAP